MQSKNSKASLSKSPALGYKEISNNFINFS